MDAGRPAAGTSPPDFEALFEATPSPLLVLDPDLVIRGVNRAYLAATASERADLVGRSIFDAFPDDPDDPHATGVRNLRASLERARDSGRPDVMALQRYPIPAGAGFEERWWSPINTPVLDDAGRTVLLLHRVEDVTQFVRAYGSAPETEPARVRRLQETESELFARAQDLGDINRELREAGERERRVSLTLQRSMLPTVPRRVGGLDVATRYRPATDALSVGGDWYDAVELGPGRVALAVGDVVGRGLNAAAAMGQLRSALTAASYGVDGPAEALEVLDRFAATVEGALGATAAQVLVDLRRGSLRYSIAGHPPPLLATADGATRFLDEAVSPPLGVAPGARCQSAEVPLPAGATLVLCTDGLVEHRARGIADGLARLERAVAAHVSLDADALADAVIAGLQVETGLEDDVALVVARATGPQADPGG